MSAKPFEVRYPHPLGPKKTPVPFSSPLDTLSRGSVALIHSSPTLTPTHVRHSTMAKTSEPLKDLDKIKPIDHAVIARPHTAVYKMHRYFARRPWSVFRALIEHYSNPGSIILDPFCGGGVTVVEGLRLGRKVIGVDINPLATFVTRMEVIDVDLDELRAAFDQIETACREKIEELYLTTCPKCGERVPADWFEWSKVCRTPQLNERAVLIACKKIRPGMYELTQGRRIEQFKPLECEQLPDELVAVHIECPLCCEKATRQALPEDVERAGRLFNEYETITRRERLKIPAEEIPDANMARENALFKRGITHFRDLFTKRNLIANGRLKKAILNAGFSDEVSEFIALAFSGSLRFSNRMVFRDEAWRGDRPFEWAKPAYWLPDSSLEANVWTYFCRRLPPIVRAKKYTKQEIQPSAKEADPKQIVNSADPTRNEFCALTRSSDSLPFPDESVDVVITDPPYGGNVQYLEVCDFWIVWLHEWINVVGVTDKSKEAITTRHRGFEGAKDLRHYREMLYRVFKECHRVLKPDR